MKVQNNKRTAPAVRVCFFICALVLGFAGADAVAQPKQQAKQKQPPVQFVPQAEDPEQFPDGPGRDDAFYACGACHAFKLVASQGFSRERWDETIESMTERHGMAKLEGKDREIILEYLAKTFPARTQPRGFQNPFLKQ
jgi:hypothetical protein